MIRGTVKFEPVSMSNKGELTTTRPFDIRFKLCLVGIYKYITGTNPVCNASARLLTRKLVQVGDCSVQPRMSEEVQVPAKEAVPPPTELHTALCKIIRTCCKEGVPGTINQQRPHW
jgi:hypothetical protein